MPEPNAFAMPDDRLEAAVDEAIVACGGDLRATIRALIVANAFLEVDRDEALQKVSAGYERRALRQAKAAKRGPQ